MSLSPGAQQHANVPRGCARPPGDTPGAQGRWQLPGPGWCGEIRRRRGGVGWRRGAGAAEGQQVPIGAGSPGEPMGAPVRLPRVCAGQPCVRSGVRPRVQTPRRWHEVRPRAGGCAGARVRTGGVPVHGGLQVHGGVPVHRMPPGDKGQFGHAPCRVLPTPYPCSGYRGGGRAARGCHHAGL